MKSLAILFISFYAVNAQINTIEQQLKTLQSIEQTKWAEIKSLIEVQDRRFQQFEQMIDTIDRRIDRITEPNSDSRQFEVCISPNDRSSKIIDTDSLCVDSWTPFRREKCYKFFDESLTYTEANDFCKRQSLSGNVATLASVRNTDEQVFVENYVFIENQPDDNVWIGVKRDPYNRSLIWEDGSINRYTNWDPVDNFVEGNDCVEIQKETVITRDKKQGLWKSSQCRGRNLVLCSYTPRPVTRPATKPALKPATKPVTRPWPPKDQQVVGAVSGDSLGLVPHGFIYFQLPGQSDPRQLWPNANWEEVSRLYAGQFFRVEGGSSARFGVAQNDSLPRLHHIQHKKKEVTRDAVYQDVDLRLPNDGTWSEYIYTGDRDYERREQHYLRFLQTTDEVRPKNQAIRIWKRI